jgi:hypothetical protein
VYGEGSMEGVEGVDGLVWLVIRFDEETLKTSSTTHDRLTMRAS